MGQKTNRYNYCDLEKLVKKTLNWYFSKDALPYWCLFLVDSGIVFFSGLFTYWVFNKTLSMFDHRISVFYTALMYTVVSWIGVRIFHTYKGFVRYSSFADLVQVGYANAVSMIIALGLSLLFEHYQIFNFSGFNQTETAVTFFIATLAIWSVRIVVKTLYDVVSSDKDTLRVLIYGALTGGVGLAKNIRSQRPARFRLCGFISHNENARHIMLMGKPVYGVDDDILSILTKRKIQAILVSPLRIDDFRKNQQLQDIFINAGVKIFIVQQAKEAQVKDGELQSEASDELGLHEVSVEDLLPRNEIKVDMDAVGAMLTGKRVLITGSAGSIGSEMVRQVAKYQPEAMMLIDQAETPEHDIRLMMKEEYPDIEAVTVVTSICRKQRMDRIFREFRPDYVFHAAAYKHVPMMEDNPSEAVLNNVYGTKVIADLSAKYGVKKFVMVSTDKAVNPTNVMGCSKRICEIYVQSLNDNQSTTQFITTRFGNVLGSNGSVIPLFRKQIKKGGPITVTDERIVRYFMLISEACKLVLEAGTMGKGGEIFVFDMGAPVKIIDLAKHMIALSGAKNVAIKITGLRDGEKLYEEVLGEHENTKPTFHDKIRIATVRKYNFPDISKEVDKLIELAKDDDDMKTVAMMKAIVPEYISNHSAYESLDKVKAN